MNLRIAVIGTGSGGASAALYLRRQGYEVVVFERVLEPQPVGAGIMLQYPGLEVLREFDLDKKALQLGTRIVGMDGWEKSGKKVVDFSFENELNLFGLGIHRSALYFLLFDKMMAEDIEVNFGVEIVEIQGSGKKDLVDSEGKKYTGFDLVVVANGARSALRKNLDIVQVDRVQEYGALWSKIPYNNVVFRNRIAQFYEGSHTMSGYMPIGKMEEYSEEYVNFFWSIKMDKVEQWKDDGIDKWKAKVLDLSDKYEGVVDKIKSLDQIMIAPYMDVELAPCYKGNVVFIGDAAHPMSPQLSQGASFAMLDSRFLAESIEMIPGNLENALSHFYKSRFKQVHYYQRLSRWLTPLFQSDNENTWFRDTLLKYGTMFKPGRDIIQGTILGYREGYFSNINPKYYKGEPERKPDLEEVEKIR